MEPRSIGSDLASAGELVRGAGPWKGRRVDTMDHDPLVVDLELR